MSSPGSEHEDDNAGDDDKYDTDHDVDDKYLVVSMKMITQVTTAYMMPMKA
jgi:hypothetical protein